MTSGFDGVVTYPVGWCFTCDTNTCEHVAQLNLCNRIAFERMLRGLEKQKPKTKLPGLTGEPWRS